MKKIFWMLPVVFLFALSIAEAGGPKTPIVAQTIGGGAATVTVTLCGASTSVTCVGTQTFVCPAIVIPAGDLLVKQSCGPAPFKVKGYSFGIVGSSFGCGGVALSGDTVTCNGGTIPDVQLKVGR